MKRLPLYKQIQKHLREQILSGRLRPGDRVPTEKELCEYFKVSQITARQALSALSDENMVYRIKGSGTYVSGRNGTDILQSMYKGLKGIVGLIFPSLNMPVKSYLFYHIQSMLHEKGYQTLIRVSDDKMEKEVEAIHMFRTFGVRGYVIFPSIDEHYNEEILRLTLDRFPHVLVDRYLPNVTNSSVTSDYQTGMIEILQELFSQGHEKIALFTQQDTNSNVHERIAGVEKAYTIRELPIEKKYWLYAEHERDDDQTKKRMELFFEQYPEVTAVVASDTILATLAYEVLHKIDRPIPQAVSLISFDDPKLPFVPYISQNIYQLAFKAVNILIKQMEESYQIVRETIPVRFIRNVSYPKPFEIELDETQKHNSR